MNKVQKYFQERKLVKEKNNSKKNTTNYMTKNQKLELDRKLTEVNLEVKDMLERRF